MRTATLTLAALALLPFLLPAEAGHTECITTSTGYEACGSVTVTCGAATATGTASGTVTWELVVDSGFGASSSTLRAPAATLAATTICPIPGCTWGTLYADGAQVTREGLCQS